MQKGHAHKEHAPPVAADLQSDANYYKDFQSVKTITLRNITPRQPLMVNS
jgi:hypothetical protein